MNKMPNSPPPAPRWLTKVPSRGSSGLWKFHKTIGNAKNALINGYSYRSEGMELYEWADEDWKLLHTWSYKEPKPW